VCNQTPLVGLFKVDCENHAQCDHVSSAIVALVIILADTADHWNCFAESVLGSLHSGVSVGNGIGDEGAKALGNALKDNTTLSSLSLYLEGG
jgi:hypothetical protein